MVRDTTEGKINFMLIRPGPMLKRWAAHLSRAAAKYDNTRKPGEPRNWQLARGLAEYERFVESAARHFEQWLSGDRDEDHAAAIFFNVNGAEYVLEQLAASEDTQSVEDRFPDLFSGADAPYHAKDWCEHRSDDFIYCERPKGHDGLHAARSYRTTPWGDGQA